MNNLLIAAIIVVIVLLIGLVWAGRLTGTWSQEQRTWLDYGNFYIVAVGLAGVLIGFFTVLLFLDRFTDKDQALGFLAALFGVITGLVGTYFGIKQSADASAGAIQLAAHGVGTTAPTVTVDPPAVDPPLGVGATHQMIATVTSIDKSPAGNVAVTLTITDGPDLGYTETSTTDQFGRATFSLTNNGNPGTDTIEVTALEGKGRATVQFQ